MADVCKQCCKHTRFAHVATRQDVKMMDPKKVLEKFGWNEGQGLGKNNNGMSEPIKVFMKRDNGGVSYVPLIRWWDRMWEGIICSSLVHEVI